MFFSSLVNLPLIVALTYSHLSRVDRFIPILQVGVCFLGYLLGLLAGPALRPYTVLPNMLTAIR